VFVISRDKIQQRGYETLFKYMTVNNARTTIGRSVLSVPKRWQARRCPAARPPLAPEPSWRCATARPQGCRTGGHASCELAAACRWVATLARRARVQPLQVHFTNKPCLQRSAGLVAAAAGARVRAAQETGDPFALGGPTGPPCAARAAACALP